MNKTDYMELAFLGGIPCFNKKLHVGYPNIGNRSDLLNRLNDILDSGRFTNYGPFVREFEQKIADFLKVKHCIAMCNGTIALEIAIRALELSGEVLVPSMTFIATAHALQWQQITPVFVDVDPESYTIDPYRIEAMITPKTSGLIAVNLWGKPCNMKLLEEIAHEHKLKLLFDTAHAFGCSYQGQMLGGFGDAEILSFHATKFFNTFEGGAVVTNNDKLAEKIRLMKNFGFAGKDNVIYIGTNGKMSEISAAMGITGLESLDDFVRINYRNYKCYQKQISNIPGIKMVAYDESQKCNYQYIVIEIDESKTEISRDLLVKIFEAENVLARRYFYPGCHRMEPYRSYFPHAGLLLPETERILDTVIIFPTGSAVSESDIFKITEILRTSIKFASEIKERLKTKNQQIPVHGLKETSNV